MATQITYRYLLDGHGPYESQKYESQEAAEKAAQEARHSIDSFHLYNEIGAPIEGTVRESINLDQPPAEQHFTDGNQPA
jgi:hypothetical protein